MNTEQLMEAVRNLLSITTSAEPLVCDVCGGELRVGRFVGNEFHCESCVRTHAQLVLDYAERNCETADAH